MISLSISIRHSSFNSSNFSFSLSSLVLVSSVQVVAAQGGISLVEDNISNITDEVIDSQAPEEDAEEVDWQWTRLLRLTVISSQYWPCCLGLFLCKN